jgi:hypothetical protein
MFANKFPDEAVKLRNSLRLAELPEASGNVKLRASLDVLIASARDRKIIVRCEQPVAAILGLSQCLNTGANIKSMMDLKPNPLIL